MKRIAILVVLLGFISACGHLANPAPPKAELTSSRDQKATCDEIKSEILYLQDQREKTQPKISAQTSQNIAAAVGGVLLLFPVVFLDVTTDKSDAYQSYVFREEYLRKMAGERNCQDLPTPNTQQKRDDFVPSRGNIVQSESKSGSQSANASEPIKRKVSADEPKVAAEPPSLSGGRLLSSAKTGDIEGIKSAIADGAWVNQKDDIGDTALMVAAYKGKSDAVEYLCQNGADLDARNPQQVTALIYAAYYNQTAAAKALLQCKPDTSVKDKYNQTALDYAWQNGNKELVLLLKEAATALKVEAHQVQTRPASTDKTAESGKPLPAFNPSEPWTGKWRSTGVLDGIWIFKQIGNTISTSAGSDYIVEGTISGKTLTGFWIDRFGLIKPKNDRTYKAQMADDGLSFKVEAGFAPVAYFTCYGIE